MTKEEYVKNQKELEIEYSKSKEELMKEFVRSNDPYKIGDKVTDHIGTIIIESKKYDWGYTCPCAVYFGIELKKDGTPNKKMTKRNLWQSNILTNE